jgi:IclR family acetate operon transcriptional repressor
MTAGAGSSTIASVDAQTAPDSALPNDGRYTVASVARALRVVGLVADAPDSGLTLTEIARAIGSSKSTAYAIARTLVDHGYLRASDPGPRYGPGMELVRLGDAATRTMPIGRVCHPVLLDLSRETGLTTRACVADHGYPVFVERVDSPGAIRFHTPLGVREMPHTSSAGKAILATLATEAVEAVIADSGLVRRTPKTITTLTELLDDLAAVRRRGFAVDDEEDVLGVFCIGAAFFDHAGVCAGAISATGINLDLPTRHVDELGQAVRAAADRVTTLLGGTPPPAR